MNKEIMKQAGFRDQVKLVEQGICPFCKKKVKMEDFKDRLSVKEFKLSGLCLKCQNKVFGV
jgi:hypothetical protein